MYRRAWSLSLLLLAGALVGCSGSTAGNGDADGEWVSTRETDGDVTTVRTLSGSKWGAPFELVREMALSEAGDGEEHVFGLIVDVDATDELILVADARLPTVRLYDRNGNYLRDIGGEGQGPGEYERPAMAAFLPGDRIFVSEVLRHHFFDLDGKPIASWAGVLQAGMVNLPHVLDDGRILVQGRDVGERPTRDAFRDAPMFLRELGEKGPVGERTPIPTVEYDPPTVTMPFGGGRSSEVPVPYAPSQFVAVGPDGSFATGVTDDYRIQVHRPDGEVLVIENYREPVPVSAEEAEYRRDMFTARMQQQAPGWEWNGDDIPDRKPAWSYVVLDGSGRIWVLRESESRRLEGDCSPAADALDPGFTSCWRDPSYDIDLFAADGELLGSGRRPDEMRISRASIRGDQIVAVRYDETENMDVGRWRLVPPTDIDDNQAGSS